MIVDPGGVVTLRPQATPDQIAQRIQKRLGEIEKELEWKGQTSRYYKDVSFLLFLVQSIDKQRVELVNELEELKKPKSLILNQAGQPADSTPSLVLS